MRNKSFTYLLPLFCKFLNKEIKELEEILFTTFTNQCYSYKKVNDKLENYFILKLNKQDNNKTFGDFLSNLKKSVIFVNRIIEDDFIYIYLKIPNEINASYNKFLSGEYSEINNKDKIIILSFAKEYSGVEFSVEINQIFSKSKQRRETMEKQLGMKIPKDVELSSIPNTLSETLIID